MGVRVAAFPRIHMGLIDLSGITSRAYGGAGFCLNSLKTKVEVRKSSESILKANQLGDEDSQDLKDAINRWEEKSGGKPISVDLLDLRPQHVGLGSKTSLILSILLGANNCWDRGLTQEDLQKLSLRGGVSGIGVNSFFNGGFIVDAGQPSSVAPPFAPSSFSTPKEIPPVTVRCDFPSNWRVSLYLPDGYAIHGNRELNFFKDNTPIPTSESLETLGVVYHGIVPAFMNEDINALSDSLVELHNTGFKERELANQSKAVKSVLNSLQVQPGVAAGMSSMGPLIYAIHNVGEAPELPQGCKPREHLGEHNGRNQGAQISNTGTG